MVRVRSAVTAQKRKKKVLKKAKGQFGHRSTRYRQAKKSVIKGLTYAYRDRKVKKREFKRLWIIRINAACQESGMTYEQYRFYVFGREGLPCHRCGDRIERRTMGSRNLFVCRSCQDADR